MKKLFSVLGLFVLTINAALGVGMSLNSNNTIVSDQGNSFSTMNYSGNFVIGLGGKAYIASGASLLINETPIVVGSSPTNGTILTYNSINHDIELMASTPAGGTASNLGTSTGFTVSGNGTSTLIFNGLLNLGNIAQGGASSTQVLSWNGTQWSPANQSGGIGNIGINTTFGPVQTGYLTANGNLTLTGNVNFSNITGFPAGANGTVFITNSTGTQTFSSTINGNLLFTGNDTFNGASTVVSGNFTNNGTLAIMPGGNYLANQDGIQVGSGAGTGIGSFGSSIILFSSGGVGLIASVSGVTAFQYFGNFTIINGDNITAQTGSTVFPAGGFGSLELGGNHSIGTDTLSIGTNSNEAITQGTDDMAIGPGAYAGVGPQAMANGLDSVTLGWHSMSSGNNTMNGGLSTSVYAPQGLAWGTAHADVFGRGGVAYENAGYFGGFGENNYFLGSKMGIRYDFPMGHVLGDTYQTQVGNDTYLHMHSGQDESAMVRFYDSSNGASASAILTITGNAATTIQMLSQSIAFSSAANVSITGTFPGSSLPYNGYDFGYTSPPTFTYNVTNGTLTAALATNGSGIMNTVNNNAGDNLHIVAGESTGNATGGAVLLDVTLPGSAGNSINTDVNAFSAKPYSNGSIVDTVNGSLVVNGISGTDYIYSSSGMFKGVAVANATLFGTNGSGQQATITLGSGISMSGNVLSATGTGGTVTSVTSADSNIGVANPTTTPVLTLNTTLTGNFTFNGTTTLDNTRFTDGSNVLGNISFNLRDQSGSFAIEMDDLDHAIYDALGNPSVGAVSRTLYADMGNNSSWYTDGPLTINGTTISGDVLDAGSNNVNYFGVLNNGDIAVASNISIGGTASGNISNASLAYTKLASTTNSNITAYFAQQTGYVFMSDGTNGAGKLAGGFPAGNGAPFVTVGAGLTYNTTNATLVSNNSWTSINNTLAGFNGTGATNTYAFNATTINTTLGNIATINLDGSASHVLYGNGTFSTSAASPWTSANNSLAGYNGTGSAVTYSGANSTIAMTNSTGTVTFSATIPAAVTFPGTVSNATFSGTQTGTTTFSGSTVTFSGSTAGGRTAGAVVIPNGGLGVSGNIFSDNIITSDNNLNTATSIGLLATNNNNAGAGNQQYSPLIQMTGQGWKTGSGGASQEIDFAWQVQPVQGASNALGNLNLLFQRAGGGYSTQLTISSTGVMTSGEWNGSIGNASIAANSQISGNLLSSGTINWAGTTAAGNVTAGQVGEFTGATIASGSAVSLTTATTANVTSVSLTAGDWEVWGVIDYTTSAATATLFQSGISTTSATMGGQDTYIISYVPITLLTLSDISFNVPRQRINVSSTTTAYLVANVTFSAGSVSAYGTIWARRIR